MKSEEISQIHEQVLNIRNRVIYLNGESMVKDAEPGVDYRMSSKFIKNIDILESISSDPIVINMNTIGGEWFYGMAIYDAIKASSCETTIVAYSWARSMSSIIFQAANTRIISPHCVFMVHWGTEAPAGHYLAVKNYCKFMEQKTENAMLDIYANKCINGKFFKDRNMNFDQVKAHIVEQLETKSDWWLDAQEAVDFGFADMIGN